MAHHQHHGAMHHMGDALSVSPQTMAGAMPSISEDEHPGEADEPPDSPKHSFSKTTPPSNVRRPSLLTKGLHTDSESLDDESLGFGSAFRRQTSRSSTCSTWSLRTDLMSDDAGVSSPSSPTKPLTFRTPNYGTNKSEEKPQVSAVKEPGPSMSATSPGQSSEPAVEQKLGRKRCIMFACGGQQNQDKKPSQSSPEQSEISKEIQSSTQRRPCALKFVCPSKVSTTKPDEHKRSTRHFSPAPPPYAASPFPSPRAARRHRDSDTTVKNESPKTARKIPPMEPRKRASLEPEDDMSEATRFHEFASPDEKLDDWVQESTCHRSRLTVDDTLAKEKNIRQIGKEAEEEALEEEELDDALSGGIDSDDDDDVSDAGFQTDDEDGFAESDDESENDSDYDWWSARRSSPVEAIMVPGDKIRPPAMHQGTPSSLNSLMSPKHRDLPPGFPKLKSKVRSHAIPIRAPSPELPDSTDFVCGTLDEDKPLEEAYMSCIEQRRAAKHNNKPQDIDPTFPDEPIDLDDDEDEDQSYYRAASLVLEDESDLPIQGKIEDVESESDQMDDHKPRGRCREPRDAPVQHPLSGHLRSNTPRTASVKRIRSRVPACKSTDKPTKSPLPAVSATGKRMRSPMPLSGAAAAASIKSKSTTLGRGQRLRSPPPRALFGHSPKRLRSPPPTKLKSPPPSRRSSPTSIQPLPFGTAFLGQRPQLTHTESLPRSPNPFAYKRAPFAPPIPQRAQASDIEEGEDTATESQGGYSRGAIDIVQGLERKRLRRRQKFYEKYCRKEEKKRERGEVKRPLPGKGAQRMRQVGMECAIYRGKRVLSV